MELKYKVQIKEGFVYDTLKESIQDFIADLPSHTYKEATSKLFSSISFAISQRQTCNR